MLKPMIFTFSCISDSNLEGRHSVRYSLIQQFFREHLKMPGTVLKQNKALALLNLTFW